MEELNMKQALVVIDMQEAFFLEEEYHLHEYEKVVKTINAAIDHARKKEISIIFIQHTEESPSEFAKGTETWELHQGLHKESTDTVIEKITWDAFYQTPLEETLNKLEIEQLIFTGAQTEYCLDTTLRNAYSRGYQKNMLVKDGHSTLDSNVLTAKDIINHHESVWNNRFVKIISVEDI